MLVLRAGDLLATGCHEPALRLDRVRHQQIEIRERPKRHARIPSGHLGTLEHQHWTVEGAAHHGEGRLHGKVDDRRGALVVDQCFGYGMTCFSPAFRGPEVKTMRAKRVDVTLPVHDLVEDIPHGHGVV